MVAGETRAVDARDAGAAVAVGHEQRGRFAGASRKATEDEVDYVVEKLTTVVRRLREMSPLYEMVKEGVDLSKMQWVTH